MKSWMKRPSPKIRKTRFPLAHPRGDIELRHVKFGYTPDRLVLRDISLKIPAGTQVAIVGATGSGKTTIIQLLTRFYDVTEGSILLDGHDLRDYRLQDLRAAFGAVLQDTALFAIFRARQHLLRASRGHDGADSPGRANGRSG